MNSATPLSQTKLDLLDAARRVLVAEGYAGLSTRRVAEAGGTQMSQIRYHFGSKEGLILALFEQMNADLVERQTTTYADPELSVSQKWHKACDYLEDDLASGYVRVLQELIAAGWSNPAIGDTVRKALALWQSVLVDLAGQLERAHRRPLPMAPDRIAALVASAFIGGEALILLGNDGARQPIREALRAVGDLIAAAEREDGG